MILDMLAEQPGDPVQYMIDWVQAGKDQASQDVGTGLPRHRQYKLLRVFGAIDKVGEAGDAQAFAWLQRHREMTAADVPRLAAEPAVTHHAPRTH
jgi:hypothetical protein